MNVIDSYLDTLFSPYPDSHRLREARVELRAMMEDQQQALLEEGFTESQAVGKVIAEFGSLEEVAPVLGIDRELNAGGTAGAPLDAAPRLQRDQVEAYAERVRSSQWMTSLAVPAFVISPVPLLALIAASGNMTPEPETWAVASGLVVLLVIVSAAVLTLVLHGSRIADFEQIEEGRFTLTAPVRSFAEQVRRDNRRSYTRSMAAAIGLWILSGIPVIISGLISSGQDDVGPLYGVCLTLLLVALGLFIHVRAGWSEHISSTLLQREEDVEMPENSTSPAIRVIAALYWPLAAAAYLIWSFSTGDWGITWLIWPVAGVLYGALWSVNSAIGSPQRNPRRPATR